MTNPERHLIGEPITRPNDGLVISAWRCEDWAGIGIGTGLSFTVYGRSHLLKLGHGDEQKGINEVVRAYYLAPAEDLQPGRNRLLNDEFSSED